jgi:hypothetical protein
MRPTAPPCSTHRPRAERDLERAHRAALAVRDTPAGEISRPALAAALATIEAAFDRAAVVNDLKIAVERHISRGPEHPAVRARFAARIALLRSRSLEDALATVERWRRNERRLLAIASAFGRGSRLPLQVLDELRLLLRWLRFKHLHAEYVDAFTALCGEKPVLEAAE